MDWSNGFAERVQRDVPLAGRTWYGLGGAARYFFSPADVDELREVLACARRAGHAVRVLGAGANLLVRDEGFDGLVLRLDAPAFTRVVYEETRVTAGGGTDLMQLARDCAYRGLAGLEALAGIPASVGGAVVMNAGGRFGQIADVVTSAALMDRDGTVADVSAEQLQFGYRHSAVGERIVLHATMTLRREPADDVVARFHENWRYKKASQPMAAHSAGCVFRNPPGDSAGRLIDQAGLKGAACGRARVSDVHGNFIVAEEGATARDVLGLVEHVQAEVMARTGVKLELEIDVW
ncbi:MAG TPA: UDP-N-acetylmuramate dehydrogenase [Phycisphaerae bacterium]|nr:UDP-N-acetylmuramate dehydrogenase [Phycisphaerae bacterium]